MIKKLCHNIQFLLQPHLFPVIDHRRPRTQGQSDDALGRLRQRRRVLDVRLLGHAEVRHHGVQPLPLLLQLQLQLTHDLHLHARLRGALVVQHVGRRHVLQELPDVRAVGLAARPLADAVAEERVLAWVVKYSVMS